MDKLSSSPPQPSIPSLTTKSWDGRGIIGGDGWPSQAKKLSPTYRPRTTKSLGWTDDTVGGDGWPSPGQEVVVVSNLLSVPWTSKSWDGRMTPSVVMDGQAKPSCCRLQPTVRAVDLQTLGWTDDTIDGDGNLGESWTDGWIDG
ncbi:hypothetical protein ml_5 [Mollivirus sibericum]|nr:hypothetical protein ml_5 [Mollivirus sibericum]ALD61807.1 hypothetical protein ml_5 [Mollivirus sibericum]